MDLSLLVDEGEQDNSSITSTKKDKSTSKDRKRDGRDDKFESTAKRAKKSTTSEKPSMAAEFEIKVPELWKKVPRKGKRINDVPFIACKIPLDERYLPMLDEEDYFMPSMLDNISAFIDLTSGDGTNKASSFLSTKITYIHLPVETSPSTSNVPNKDQINRFLTIAKQLSERFPNKAIAVSDTYGYNISGYLICCYLVENMDWSVDAALSAFAESRHPGVFDKELINDLYKKYGEKRERPYPPIPSWIPGSEPLDAVKPYQPPSFSGGIFKSVALDLSNYDMGDLGNYEDYIPPGVEGKVEITIPGVLVKSPHSDKLKNIYTELLGNKCGWPFKSFQKLTESSLKEIDLNVSLITWNPVATELLMLILGDGAFFVDRNFQFYHLGGLKFIRNDGKPLNKTILLGEFLYDKQPDSTALVPRFLFADLLVFEGRLIKKRFDQRLAMIESEIIQPRRKLNVQNEPVRMRTKLYLPLKTGFTKLIKSILPSLPHKYKSLCIVSDSSMETPDHYEYLLNDEKLSQEAITTYLSN